jgi:hypothetical protein
MFYFAEASFNFKHSFFGFVSYTGFCEIFFPEKVKHNSTFVEMTDAIINIKTIKN